MNNHSCSCTGFPDPPTLLGGMSVEAFLRDYWQKKPLLIRSAWPGLDPVLSPEELAGLACEEWVESRLVREHGATPWEVRHGPFAEEDFTTLPATHWTLLVQAVDRHVPAVAELLDHFRFIPAWRLDDLMISYAPEHGSVGPHVDNYDVFLLQGRGRRRWAINEHDHGMEDFIPGLELNILREFHATESWVLEPGDLLYLPPGVAHHGTALDDCMTLSIGFRAPARNETLAAFADDVLLHHEDRHYRDPDLQPQTNSGELTAETLTRLRQMLREPLADDAVLDEWLGRQLTQVSDPQPEPQDPPWPLEHFIHACRTEGCLVRTLDSRLLFSCDDSGGTLYANGEAYRLDPALMEFIPLLTELRRLDLTVWIDLPIAPALLELLHKLFNRGLFAFDED
jgi:50S ribosomal protein L16 3-hydroxylase